MPEHAIWRPKAPYILVFRYVVGIAPLKITRLLIYSLISVELQGFEPWTPALQRQCSSQLSYSPF